MATTPRRMRPEEILDRCLQRFSGPLMCLKWSGEAFIRVLGPILIVFAILLISLEAVIWFTQILPYYTPFGSLLNIPHIAISLFVLFNILFNYIMVVITPPGTTPPPKEEDKEILENIKREAAPKRGEGFSRYCKVCKKSKPPRTHHCHICNGCVLKMDHHCPWVNNCVGHFNHRFFYLFMFYTWFACFYVSVFCLGIFFNIDNIIGEDQITAIFSFPARSVVMFTFALCVSVSCALGLLLAWHTYLALTSQTTIEFYFNRFNARQARLSGQPFVNEYDLGWNKNWNLFFITGKYWFSWLLPSTKPTQGDGITFPTRTELHNTSLIV